MTEEEIRMVKMVRESDVIDLTEDTEVAHAFRTIWGRYVETLVPRNGERMATTEKGKGPGPEIMHVLSGTYCGDFPIERTEEIEAMFQGFLKSIGCDSYGHCKDEDCRNDRGGYEDDTFAVNPYYWGFETDEGYEEKVKRPNFLYKPTGFEIRWYKYPFRDSYANRSFTLGEFKDILDRCRQKKQERQAKQAKQER